MSQVPSPPGFFLGTEIGRGGYSVVYNATRKGDNAVCCAKVAKKSVLEDKEVELHFINESKVLREFDHPCIVRFIDLIDYEGFYYLIMEKCVGKSLLDVVNEGWRPSKRQQTIKVFRQLISVLDYLRSKSFVHRDIKPENIIVDENDNIKLLDFGFCCQISDSTYCAGSLHYAPPEYLGTKMSYGTAGDIWSAGIVLYVIFTGCLPWKADSDEPRRICEDEVEIPLWVPTQAADLIRSMLKKDPSERPAARDILEHPWLKGGTRTQAKCERVFLETQRLLVCQERKRFSHTVLRQPKCLRDYRNVITRCPDDAREMAARQFFEEKGPSFSETSVSPEYSDDFRM